MKKPQVCIITGYGINADRELAAAFSIAGADASTIHINDLISAPALIDKYSIIGFPGGFSFGDHLGSGLVFGEKVKKHLSAPIEKFIKDGKLIIGICNGFQVLVKMGILPNLSGESKQEVSLVHNDSGAFIDDWVRLKAEENNRCLWLKDIDVIEAPIRHGEGKFIADPDIINKLIKSGQTALKYTENPNGSMADIAGITDPSGRILGMMPHPEAFLYAQNHPLWKRNVFPKEFGLAIFLNAVKYVEKI